MSDYLGHADNVLQARAYLIGEAAQNALVQRDSVTVYPGATDAPLPLAVRQWAAGSYGIQVSWPATGEYSREDLVLALRRIADAVENAGIMDTSAPPASMPELSDDQQ